MHELIAVIGAGECDAATERVAEDVGTLLARRGYGVITGGLGGVMAAASRGAAEAGGLVIGILPGEDPAAANPWVGVPIATGTGDARNAVITNTASGFVAVGGSYGTLSEIAFALKRGKPIVSVGSWQVDPKIHQVETAEAAVDAVLQRVGGAA